MGWAYGRNAEGREIGYAVKAKCDQRGCKKRIDRGLGYVCGGMHDGNENGCGGYFCSKHLYFGRGAKICKRCLSAQSKEAK